MYDFDAIQRLIDEMRGTARDLEYELSLGHPEAMTPVEIAKFRKTCCNALELMERILDKHETMVIEFEKLWAMRTR